MPSNTLKATYEELCSALGDVKLLAVSKHHDAARILEIYGLGQRLFAENYVQEAIDKIAQLPADIEWHFIGQLQSNKTKLVAQHFSWVQTIDRVKIADRLNEHCAELQKQLQICIAVNVDAEQQKAGVRVDELTELAQYVAQLPHLKLRGLMAIPRPRETYEQQLAVFMRVKQLFDGLHAQGLQLDTLSMGMSGDFQAALAAGSTMVRIGTKLFGPRD